jgi:RNAse (barnase) inhibitor barstar
MSRKPIFDPTADNFALLWQRFDWLLLQNSAIHRVDDNDGLQHAGSKLGELSYNIAMLEADSWQSIADVYDSFALQLSFPDQGGRHLDGLADYMRDLAAFQFGTDVGSTGTAILIKDFESFAKRELVAAVELLETISRQCHYSALLNHPMICIVSTGTVLPDVGSTPIMRIP